MQEDWLGPETLTAAARAGVALKVAVAKSSFGPDPAGEWSESLAAAYEEFVNDPEASAKDFDWIDL